MPPHQVPKSVPESELRRTLGLPSALAIGVGTMVGAGIFVFPGLAAEQAGPAAMVSFAIGGVVALLVALCTAELATAMPHSGGGYTFVSRTFGPLAGALVGIGQVFGLCFAGAFYLVAFGRYAVGALSDAGLVGGDAAVTATAVGSAVVLVAVNLTGARSAGRLQRVLVVVLTGVLVVLFGYGALRAAGALGGTESPPSGPFAPHGVRSVFTTSALVFTSYLGFVQIVTVAGEVRRPERTLPRALIGSVLAVTVLYVLALFVTTTLFGQEELASLEHDATKAVAEELLGRRGELVVLVASLAATLSSANASILSASRGLYALARDRVVPAGLRRVHGGVGAPWAALVAVGGAIAVLPLLGRLELLAQVASILHLLLYGGICLSVLRLRLKPTRGYAPSFRLSGALLVAALGALASLGMLAFMDPSALGVGAGLLVVAAAWYAGYARGRAQAAVLGDRAKSSD